MLLATPAIILTAAVTILAALVCLGTSILVARIRREYQEFCGALSRERSPDAKLKQA